MRTVHRRGARFAILALATLAGMAGVSYALGAFAATPETSVIQACMKNANGRLRVVDDNTMQCGFRESPISWNASGPTGGQGPQGPTGPVGPQGPTGAAGPVAPQLSAQVDRNGTFLTGRNVLSATRLSTGFYRVTFNQPVAGCLSFVSIPFNIGFGSASQHFQDTASQLSVLTYTQDVPGGPIDLRDAAFQLAVFC